MVEWLRVGFVHGVMNTDNMSILGLTIDYGPYSFVDNYDPLFTPNTTDLPGKRYAFSRQASVAKWNLGCLGGAILPLLPDQEIILKVLDGYDNIFWNSYYSMMVNKTGLDSLRQDDVSLLNDLEKLLQLIGPDMTIFYQLLIDMPMELENKEMAIAHFEPSYYSEISEVHTDTLFNWIKKYTDRISANFISLEERTQKMQKASPRFILRNYLLHQCIEELEKGDHSLFQKLHEAMKEPYSNKWDEFFAKRPSWASEKAGCSQLSCSS